LGVHFFQQIIEMGEKLKVGKPLPMHRFRSCVSDYLSIIYDPKALSMPSGYDLWAMETGGIAALNRKNSAAESLNWPFDDLQILVFKTSWKIPTHEHLKMLRDFNITDLQYFAESAIEGLRMKNQNQFLNGINGYAEALDGLGFLAGETKSLLSKISNQGVLAKKGCGALGLDVIILVVDKRECDVLALKSQLFELGLEFIADQGQVSNGVNKVVFSDGVIFCR
jgi:mevalonate kinase